MPARRVRLGIAADPPEREIQDMRENQADREARDAAERREQRRPQESQNVATLLEGDRLLSKSVNRSREPNGGTEVRGDSAPLGRVFDLHDLVERAAT